MFVPTVRRHGVGIPMGAQPILLSLIAVVVAVAFWAVLSPSTVSNDAAFVPLPSAGASDMRSVAYIAPGGSSDSLIVRHLSDDGPGSVVATFPTGFNIHARGAASPLGAAAAVLSVSPSTIPLARLSIVDLPSGSAREAMEAFDYLSPVAWAGDGSRAALRRSSLQDSAGRVAATVLEVQADSLAVRQVAVFEGVYEVAPVGYSMDGTRLFIVVIDGSGSNLWVERAGRLTRLATLTPGRTRDWALSPDGARLAFVEVVGLGERAYRGRSLVIATGNVVDEASTGNQLGAAWLPGSQVPQFGGPGGQVQLSDQPPGAAYVIPSQWSPDGSTLVATVYSARDGGTVPSSPSIEIVTAERRLRLSNEEGAAFVGWVRDLP